MINLTPFLLDDLRDPVDRCAALIEDAFVEAGKGLGEGLAGFDGLVREMNDVLAGLGGNGMTASSQALATLATRLVAAGRALPRDAASLQDLVAGNAAVAKHLDALLNDVRMMFIIARSARIEGVVFGERTGLDAFTNEIAALTRTVQEEVERCAQAHALLTGRIGRIAAAQADLDRNYRDKLAALAEDLSEMFNDIETRQGETAEAMRKLGERGAAIAAGAGMALMALQSGDATRQRLEHVASAIGIARDIVAGTRAVDEDRRDVTVAAVLRLQALQIRELSTAFDSDVAEVDNLLIRLGRDAVDLAESGSAGIQGRDGVERSFLAAFRARLTEAAALVGTCERARRDVEDAIVLFRDEITALSTTVAALEAVTVNLVMIGINSGLKAARLGTRGRSLTVIADELKRLAGVITGEAARLVEAFAQLEITSHRLDRGAIEAGLASSDSDLLAIAAVLEAHDTSMTRCFAIMRERALGFDADMTRSRDRFRQAVSGSADLTATAERLDDLSASCRGGASFNRAAPCLEGLLWPLYTMACERDLHAALLGSNPLPGIVSMDADAAEIDEEFLFAMAGWPDLPHQPRQGWGALTPEVR